MKLLDQIYFARLGDPDKADHACAVAVVKTFNGGWIGEARVPTDYVKGHASREEATKALAKALRDLADQVEREEP